MALLLWPKLWLCCYAFHSCMMRNSLLPALWLASHLNPPCLPTPFHLARSRVVDALRRHLPEDARLQLCFGGEATLDCLRRAVHAMQVWRSHRDVTPPRYPSPPTLSARHQP